MKHIYVEMGELHSLQVEYGDEAAPGCVTVAGVAYYRLTPVSYIKIREVYDDARWQRNTNRDVFARYRDLSACAIILYGIRVLEAACAESDLAANPTRVSRMAHKLGAPTLEQLSPVTFDTAWYEHVKAALTTPP